MRVTTVAFAAAIDSSATVWPEGYGTSKVATTDRARRKTNGTTRCPRSRATRRFREWQGRRYPWAGTRSSWAVLWLEPRRESSANHGHDLARRPDVTVVGSAGSRGAPVAVHAERNVLHDVIVDVQQPRQRLELIGREHDDASTVRYIRRYQASRVCPTAGRIDANQQLMTTIGGRLDMGTGGPGPWRGNAPRSRTSRARRRSGRFVEPCQRLNRRYPHASSLSRAAGASM